MSFRGTFRCRHRRHSRPVTRRPPSRSRRRSAASSHCSRFRSERSPPRWPTHECTPASITQATQSSDLCSVGSSGWPCPARSNAAWIADHDGPASSPWARAPAHIPSQLAAQRCRGRARPHRAAGPAGHGIRRARRAPTDHRAVHVDPLLDRVRALRPVQDPRAWAGLVARAHDRGDDPPPHRGRRRPCAGGRPRIVARAHGRGDDVGRRGCQARLRRGPDFAPDHDRLYERARADHPGQPAAQALRVLGRRRRFRRRADWIREWSREWRHCRHPRWRSGCSAWL